MGWFSKKPAPQPRATVERIRTLYVERNGPVPSISAQLDAVPGVLGVPRSDIDELEAVTLIHRLFIMSATQFTVNAGKPDPSAEFDEVVRTSGFDNDALWDVVFGLEFSGVAIAEALVADWFASGRAAELVATALQENGKITPHRQVNPPAGEPQGDAHNVHQAMLNMGLYFVAYGPGDPQDLAAAISAAVPEVTTAQGNWIAGENSVVRWMIHSSAAGSAAVFLPMIPSEESQEPISQFVDRLSAMPEPWTVATGKLDAFVPEECAAIINSGSPLELTALDALAPSPVREQRQALRQALLAGGFVAVSPALLKGTFPAGGERTQVVMCVFSHQLGIVSPVCEGVTSELPEHLRGLDVGRYELAPVPPFAALQLVLDYATESELVWQEAYALAEYADAHEMQLNPHGGDLL